MERKAVLIFLPGQIHPSQYSSVYYVLLFDSFLSQDLVIKYHDFQQQIVNVIPELNPLPCECVVLPMIGMNSDIYDKKVKATYIFIVCDGIRERFMFCFDFNFEVLRIFTEFEHMRL